MTDLLSHGKTVFLRHHHIQHHKIVFTFGKSFIAGIAVGIEIGAVALGLQILTQKHAEIFVVFAK